jgi:hypothetical protein
MFNKKEKYSKEDKIAIEAIELALTECVGCVDKQGDFLDFLKDLKDSFRLNNMKSDILNELIANTDLTRLRNIPFLEIDCLYDFTHNWSYNCDIYKLNTFIKYKKYKNLEDFFIDKEDFYNNYDTENSLIDGLFTKNIIKVEDGMLELSKKIINELNNKAKIEIKKEESFKKSETVRKKNFLESLKDKFK